MFNKEVYSSRRRALKEKLKGEQGIALFLGNVESPVQYKDNCYKWRQDSNWLYFFGIDKPRFAATIDLESGEETIYADDFSIDDIIWMGAMPSVKEQAEAVGVSRTAPYSAISEAIKNRKVHILPVSRYYNALMLSDLLGGKAQDYFSAGKKGCALASSELVRAVIELRLVKEQREIEEIELACNLGTLMHNAARNAIRLGKKEQDIVGEMEGIALSKGWGTSFSTILTQHGEIFHCDSHEAEIAPGKLLVIDAGVESNTHYVSDFTRTYPTSGRFTTKQREIYQTVYECNELAYKLIRPGIEYREIHLAVSRHILENLKSIGLLQGRVDDMLTNGLAGLFMPHGLGHNMGLQVHDMEDLGEDLVGYDAGQIRSSQLGLGSLRMARKLVCGNVITDEPGIYFIPALIEEWRKNGTCSEFINFSKLEDYYDFGGIRLEDDILVTEEGARRLGAERLPIAPDDIEQIMQ